MFPSCKLFCKLVPKRDFGGEKTQAQAYIHNFPISNEISSVGTLHCECTVTVHISIYCVEHNVKNRNVLGGTVGGQNRVGGEYIVE